MDLQRTNDGCNVQTRGGKQNNFASHSRKVIADRAEKLRKFWIANFIYMVLFYRFVSNLVELPCFFLTEWYVVSINLLSFYVFFIGYHRWSRILQDLYSAHVNFYEVRSNRELRSIIEQIFNQYWVFWQFFSIKTIFETTVINRTHLCVFYK